MSLNGSKLITTRCNSAGVFVLTSFLSREQSGGCNVFMISLSKTRNFTDMLMHYQRMATSKSNFLDSKAVGIHNVYASPRSASQPFSSFNYGTHKHKNIRTWLAEHPRFHLHFLPNSCSSLNLVERFFA